MIFTDTHSHIYDATFDGDRDEAIARAIEAGVTRLFLPAVDGQSHDRLFDLAQRHPHHCLPMMGLHPTSVNNNPAYLIELARVEELLRNPPVERFYAVGEVGLDLYWSTDWEAQQREVFERQIELSLEFGLPLVIHTRSAWSEMIEVLERYKGRGVRGVMHSFSGSEQDYSRIKSLGEFVFGIGGVVTYKKSDVANVVPQMALEDIVLETDAPYLTPVPHRGTRNESSYIPLIAAKVAELKGVSIEQVALQTTKNSERIFSL